MLVTKQISLTIATLALSLALPTLAAPAGKCGSGGIQNKAVVNASAGSSGTSSASGQGQGRWGGHQGHGYGMPSASARMTASAGQANVKDDFSSRYVHNDDDQDQTTTKTYVQKTTQMAAAPSQPPANDDKPEASSAAPSATPSAAAPQNGDDWFAIANEWRVKMGHPAFTKSDKLIANALDCVKSSNGKMVHKLNDGSFGQVLAPGQPDGFLKVYVGGWLCEMPNEAGLDGICSTLSNGWAYNGQTGHAEILNGGYKSIGCALYAGIWACDVA